MARTIVTGIDIGTYQVKVAVAEKSNGARSYPRIIGTGFAESRGLRHGYIVSQSDVIRAIRGAVAQAEKASGMKIRRAYLAVGGVGLDEVSTRGETIVSRGDSEITELDVERAIAASESRIPKGEIQNRRIIHSIPLKYRIDGNDVLSSRPVGMKGMKLGVDMLYITSLEQHLSDLIYAVEEAGVEVDDVMAAPLAASFVALTKQQKMAGCVLANVGSATLSIAVFENGIPISIKVFPMGSTDVTNDIALGLKIPLEEAQQLKHGAITHTNYPKKKLEDIVAARLSDMFELVEAHLKRIGKDGLLPAGIVITGGGSSVASVSDLARATLRLPARVASLSVGEGRIQLRDASWAVACGLSVWGFTADETESGIKLSRRAGHGVWAFLRQFLP